jgi:putative ATP-binding cassette transporter
VKAINHFRKARDEADGLMKHLRALVEGTKELKLHSRRRRAFVDKLLWSTASALRRYNVTGMTIYTAAASWGQTLVFVLVGFTLFALPQITSVEGQARAGYVLVLLYLMTPLQVLLNTLPNIGRANIAIKKVEELGVTLERDSTERMSDLVPGPAPDWDKLELREVTHTYKREGEESDFTLGPLDLALYPGELIFLVGGNGSGKTTLAKLMVGLYAPESGSLHFRGEEITDQNREEFRQQFSVVFSDFYLFESLLGLETAELDDRARACLLQLQLAHKVQVKDGVLSTTDLSNGQRKRLALLTAYLEDRPIYLFDEWAADQDPVFKRIFYYELLPELKARGKTAVVISHDDQYYHIADRIVKLDYGKVSSDKVLAEREKVGQPLPLSGTKVQATQP